MNSIEGLQAQITKLEQERSDKQNQYSDAVKWLRDTLNESGTIRNLLANKQEEIAVFLKGGSLWEKIKAGFAILFSREIKIAELYNLYKNPNLSTIVSNINDPVMQKSLVQDGGVLEFVGKNADHLDSILQKAKNAEEKSPTRKMQDQLTPAFLKILKDDESRTVLKDTILKNYMKFPYKKDIEQKDYKYNYWPRSSLAQFYPDWLTLTADIMTLTDQQEGAEKLKAVLGRQDFLDNFVEMVRGKRPLDSFSNGKTEILEKLWQTKDNEVSEKIKEQLIANFPAKENNITEEWYLMGPEILTALKQNQIDNIDAILRNNRIDTNLAEELKTNLKNLWFAHEKTVKQVTLENNAPAKQNIDKIMHCWRNGQGMGHSIAKNLEFFGIDIGFIENAHSLFEKPADVAKIVQAVKDSDFTTLLTILKQHDLKSFIEGNPQHLQNLIKTILDKNPFILDSTAMPTDEILSISQILGKNLEKTAEILSLLNKGNYAEMISKLLQFEGIHEHLKDNKEAYAKYVSELTKEGQPLEMLQNIDEESLQKLVSNLLGNPEQIQDLLTAYKKSEYMKIADILSANDFLMKFLQNNNKSLSELVKVNSNLQQILSWALNPEILLTAKSALKSSLDKVNVAKGYQISPTDAAKIAAIIEGKQQTKLADRLQAVEYNSMPQDEQDKWKQIQALVEKKDLSNTEFNTVNFNGLNIDGFNFNDTNLIGCSFENA
jgi:hypothetical protein